MTQQSRQKKEESPWLNSAYVYFLFFPQFTLFISDTHHGQSLMWKRPINNKASDCSKSWNLWQVVACSQKWFGFGVSLWRLAKCFMVLYHPCAVTSTCLQIRNPTYAQHHHGEEMTWAWKDAPPLLTSRPQTVDLCTSCSYLVNQGKQCASLSVHSVSSNRDKISVSGKIGDSSLFGEKYKGQNILFLAFLWICNAAEPQNSTKKIHFDENHNSTPEHDGTYGENGWYPYLPCALFFFIDPT